MKTSRTVLGVLLLMFAVVGLARAADGLITKPSAYSSAETLSKLEAALTKRGFVIFARLDHSAAATSKGLKMPASTVLVFGNPKAGTPAMLKKPTLAIDLPLKALIWEDASGKVMLSYNSAAYVQGTIFPRHGLPTNKKRQEEIEKALNAITNEAVK